MKNMWNFYIAAAVLLCVCISCGYAKNKQRDSKAGSTADVRNYPVDADGMEKKTEPLSFQFLEGDWQLYDAIEGSFQLLMSFDDSGKMLLSKIKHPVSIPGVEVLDEVPIVSYDGTYRIDDCNYITVELKDCDKNSEKVVASIIAIPDGNFCRMTFEDCVEGIANKGNSFLMFNTAQVYPVDLGDKPSVTELFKAVLPFVDNDVIKDAATLIINGKQPGPEGGATKTIDLKSGYLSYLGGGAPASGMESCIWRCDDGTTLLAINVLGESPDIQHTRWFKLIRYYPDIKSVKLLERESERIFINNSRHPMHISLPHKGKNIELIELNVAYEATSTETIPWTGNGFERRTNPVQ